MVSDNDYVSTGPSPIMKVPPGVTTYRIKKADMEKVLMGGSWEGVLPMGVRTLNHESVLGISIILKTGAKGFHYGNGFWAFFGYTWDNSDVNEILNMLNL